MPSFAILLFQPFLFFIFFNIVSLGLNIHFSLLICFLEQNHNLITLVQGRWKKEEKKGKKKGDKDNKKEFFFFFQKWYLSFGISY